MLQERAFSRSIASKWAFKGQQSANDVPEEKKKLDKCTSE